MLSKYMYKYSKSQRITISKFNKNNHMTVLDEANYYRFERELLGCVSSLPEALAGTPSKTQVEMRWWAMA